MKIIKNITLGLAVAASAATASAAPILWDITNDGNASSVDATVADFTAAGVTEYLGGASVSIVHGSTNMTDGAITVTSTVGVGPYVNGNTCTGDGGAILQEYFALKNVGPDEADAATLTFSGLTNALDANTTYSFYLWGMGDNGDQEATFKFDGVTLTGSEADPDNQSATNYMAKFTFSTGAVVTNTLEVKWWLIDEDGGNDYAGFNGFAIVADSTPDLYTSITPPNGATYVTNVPTIEVSVTDGSKNVDTGSFTMALVLDGATNDVTPSVVIGSTVGGVTPFSYTPASMLENEAEYTVLYSVAGIGGSAGNYISSFTTAPDLHYSTTPEDGGLYVATNTEVSVTFTNVAVSLSNLYDSAELFVNSADVSGDIVISYPTNGVMKFEYAHGGLDFSTTYDIQLNVSRTDGITNAVEFSFDSALDSSIYLVGPGIRNGGFELVDGTAGESGQVQISSTRVDDWSDATGAGAKTEAIGSPSEGTRALVTGNGSETYNLTDTLINDGDIFEFKWTVPGRPNGVSVGLAYDDGGTIQIVSNSLVFTSGVIGEFSGSYLFDSAKDTDAIGKKVGIIIIDDNTGSGAVYVDEVRLLYGNIAVQSVSPAADATGVAKTEPIQVVIAEAASQVDTNSIALTVDGVDVTAESVINDTASGVTITYASTNAWAVGRHYISVSADGDPEGTASRSWSFLVDPTGTYLISPTIRNGSFELVSGIQGSGTESDWAVIDDWSDNGSGAVAKTEDNGIASDGSRIMVTGNAGAIGSETYNMTTTTIGNGDRFGYSVVNVGRANGATVALAYDDGGSIVVVSNSATFVSGGSTPRLVSGEYTFTAGTEPGAIGKPIGFIIIDDGAGGGAVQFDEVRLYKDETEPTEDPVITDFGFSNGMITISWESQNIGLYSLQSKSDMANHTDWVTVLSNLPSGNLTTNILIGEEDQEFFRVISE